MSENNTLVTEEEGASLEKLPDLKTIREERGLTIEDIFLKTRINVVVLNAIENGDFHLLPAPFYAKKFIAVYAGTIGIDPGIILDHYQRYVDENQPMPEEVKIVEPQRTPLKRYLLYAVPAVVIIVASFVMYAFFQEQKSRGSAKPDVSFHEQKDVAPRPTQEVVPKPAPAVKEQPLEAAPNVPQTPPPVINPKETTQVPSNGGVKLLVEATEETWLNITEDHKPPFQITLKAGEKLSRSAREFFIVDVGNAAGVNITFQGAPLGSLGRKGQVVHLRLPKQ